MASKIEESSFIALLNDINFEKIELGLKSVNFFDILKISRAEIRHSNFLGWLLNPNENHGLNELVLKRVLRDLFSKEQAFGLNSLDAETINYNNVEIRREWQHIDLLIIIDNKVICIENKVDSKEHFNQLKKYKEVIEENFINHEKIFVYLTPMGESPKKNDVYIPYSYERFAEILSQLINIYGNTLNLKNLSYINDYLVILKRKIMQNDELNELAIKLYKSHKETLDFIFENRPDIELELRALIEEKVIKNNWVIGSRNKGYVRFLTKPLQDLIPIYEFSNGWPNKEAFLFEIDFYWSNQKSFIIKTTISPGDESIREILISILSKVDGAQKPWGEKWICYFSEKRKFDLEQIASLTYDEKVKLIDDLWPTVEEMVNKVENAILNDERLKKLKHNY